MESLYLLVPVALIFIAIAIKVLFWAINSGQYDDLDTEAHRILFDEDAVESKKPKSAEAEAASKPAVQETPPGGNTSDKKEHT